MKLKGIISAAIAAFLLTGCSAKPEPEYVDPPFFCVENSETGGRVYMLGSMHAGKKGTVYPEEVLSAFEESDIIACEVDTVALSKNKQLLTECTAMLLCPEGTTAADYLGESYEEIRSFLKSEKLYNAAYDRYLPVLWENLLSNNAAEKCGLDSEYGTETIFLNKAKSEGKTIVELESAKAQYELMAAEPISLSRWSLENSVRDSDTLAADMEELYGAWAAGDGEKLTALLTEEEPPEELSEEYADYYAAMYSDRQRLMADSVISSLENGEQVFMFVGALHFFAEPDILDFLAEAGYEVTEGENVAA